MGPTCEVTENIPELIGATLGAWGVVVTSAEEIETMIQKCDPTGNECLCMISSNLGIGEGKVLSLEECEGYPANFPGIVMNVDVYKIFMDDWCTVDLLDLPFCDSIVGEVEEWILWYLDLLCHKIDC